MAETTKTIHFKNGIATGITLPIGTYHFHSSTIPGYTDGNVQDFKITRDTKALTLYISAAGVLTVSVIDKQGNNITDGALVLSDKAGRSTYGKPKPIDNGIAAFQHVPHGKKVGIPVYISQLASDRNHDPITTPAQKSMDDVHETATIYNELKRIPLNVTLEDPHYPDMLELTGDLTFTN